VKRIFRLNLDYQYGDFKDPYTMISPSKFNRFRATARVNLKEVYFSGLLFYRGSKSDLLDGEPWESTRLHLNFRAGYHGKTLSLYAGYAPGRPHRGLSPRMVRTRRHIHVADRL
jgi:hypothetical protein